MYTVTLHSLTQLDKYRLIYHTSGELWLLKYRVYFMRMPLGLVGGVQDTIMALSFVARALILAGASGTGEKRNRACVVLKLYFERFMGIYKNWISELTIYYTAPLYILTMVVGVEF